MPNPYSRPWRIDAAGQLLNTQGVPLALIRPQTTPEVRDLLERAPLQDALLTTFAVQLGRAHRDETEMLEICDSALHLISVGLVSSAVELLTAAVANRRGEEAPSC